jgi:hypothetical protein
MRYLRKYNESLNQDELIEQSIKEFCEIDLAYLIDEGVRILFKRVSITWDESKDHIIPFLGRLINNYQLFTFMNDGTSNTNKSFFFCVRIDGTISDLAVSKSDISNIDQIVNTHFKVDSLIMDEILFFVML